MESDEENGFGYETFVSLGDQLLRDLDSVPNDIGGISKLRRKIRQELNGLQKAKQSNTLKKENLTCSNLNHYRAFVKCILEDCSCVSVLEVFILDDEILGRKKICVDIVTNEKRKWKKVIARNPKALSQISVGDGEYLQKSIVDHAEEFLLCANQNLVFYKPPVVEFIFACGIEKQLADTLQNLGIIVSGEIIGGDDVTSGHQLHNTGEIKKLNLDVTAMFAYISALTNGHVDRKIKGKILNLHAEWERKNPVKPILDKLFQGKELYACEKAMSDFKSIVSIVAGEGEKKRAEELCKRITVVPDCPLQNLEPKGHMKERGLAVFGTGQKIQAITVTANSAFIRSANTQGIHLDVFIHEPRSLTEQKEIP